MTMTAGGGEVGNVFSRVEEVLHKRIRVPGALPAGDRLTATCEDGRWTRARSLPAERDQSQFVGLLIL
jgi:hypothetical protein